MRFFTLVFSVLVASPAFAGDRFSCTTGQYNIKGCMPLSRDTNCGKIVLLRKNKIIKTYSRGESQFTLFSSSTDDRYLYVTINRQSDKTEELKLSYLQDDLERSTLKFDLNGKEISQKGLTCEITPKYQGPQGEDSISNDVWQHSDDGVFGRDAFVLAPKVKNLLPYLSKAKSYKLGINQSIDLRTGIKNLENVTLEVQFIDTSKLVITFHRDWFGKVMRDFSELLKEANSVKEGKPDLKPAWYEDSYEISQEEFLKILSLPYLQGLHTGGNTDGPVAHYIVTDDPAWQ